MKRFFKKAEGNVRAIRDHVLRNNDTTDTSSDSSDDTSSTDSDNDLVIVMPEPNINVCSATPRTNALDKIQEKIKINLSHNTAINKQHNDGYAQSISNKLESSTAKNSEPELLATQTASNQIALKLETSNYTTPALIDKQPVSTKTENVDEDIDIIIPDCFDLSKPYGRFPVLSRTDCSLETLGSVTDDDILDNAT